MLDSGAFSDKPERRLCPEGALARQLAWESATARRCDCEGWQAEALVSYDRLIDETWVNGVRHKRRWTVKTAEAAVEETVNAARFLAARRSELEPRRLILACQGVEAAQYAECVAEVLAVAQPQDWLGLGGWCILGRFTSWLPEFWRTIRLVLPVVRAAGLHHVHIFGVLYGPALGGLLWLCDELGLSVSTDSGAPILACTYTRSPKKAGVRAPYWRDNVRWWREHLENLGSSTFYRRPPNPPLVRQLELFEV